MRLKKVKNAMESIINSPYFVSRPEDYKTKWNTVFNNSNPIHIEIGMGKGNFIINMAKNNPNINYIGIEMYDSVMCKAVHKLKDEDFLNNLKLVLLDANIINNVFEKEISRIYLNFSDPWPKKRHAKRRLTSKHFLNMYDDIFKSSKEIFMKTDNNDLFDFSIGTLEDNGYKLKNVTRDLYKNGDVCGNVMTEYEEKFKNAGVCINRLEAYK